jgi:transcriptional regulator with XRE-family HTH domain
MDKKTFSADEVKAWQERMGFTYEKAAEKLGVGRATFARYLTDGAGRTVALAMLALEAGIDV